MSLAMQLHYTDNMSSLSVQHVHQCLQELVENGVGLSVVRCRMLVGWNLALPVTVLSTVEWDFGFQEQQS